MKHLVLPPADPFKALVDSYDTWRKLDPDGLADRHRVCLCATKILDITHGSNRYVLRDADDELLQYPVSLKTDVAKSLMTRLIKKTDPTCKVEHGVTLGYIKGSDSKKLNTDNAEALSTWKNVYAYALRDIHAPWVKDLLAFFDHGLKPEITKPLKTTDIIKIVISNPRPCALIDIDGVMDAFDRFTDDVLAIRLEPHKLEPPAATLGIDPLTGQEDQLVTTMIYMPSTVGIFGKDVTPNNGPLASNRARLYTTNFFGISYYTTNLNVSDTTDFKTAAMLNYLHRRHHIHHIGNEAVFWALTGEDVLGLAEEGATLIDIDDIGEYMFKLSQGLPVTENGTFGFDMDGRAIMLNVWRIRGNSARIVWKGLKSYTWEMLSRNHRQWRNDTFLWETKRETHAQAMLAGIDGRWDKKTKDGKPRYKWGLADALQCNPTIDPKHEKVNVGVNAELRDDLIRMCVDGANPSPRVVLALSQAVQSYHSTHNSLIKAHTDLGKTDLHKVEEDLEVIRILRARLAKCVHVRYNR